MRRPCLRHRWKVVKQAQMESGAEQMQRLGYVVREDSQVTASTLMGMFQGDVIVTYVCDRCGIERVSRL